MEQDGAPVLAGRLRAARPGGSAGWRRTSAEPDGDSGEDTMPMPGGSQAGDPEEFVARARTAREVELRTLDWFRRTTLGTTGS